MILLKNGAIYMSIIFTLVALLNIIYYVDYLFIYSNTMPYVLWPSSRSGVPQMVHMQKNQCSASSKNLIDH